MSHRLTWRRKALRWAPLLLGGTALFLGGAWLGPGGGPFRASGTVTPTPDRLAKPTLPANPAAADLGSQVYWLDCMPCHGDRGQGLTDEFRQAYPPEDRNCWASGCHGERPYENGFTLPFQIPPLIGPGALARFPSAAALDAFVRAAMPRQKPGSLTGEEYSQVVAFLARANGLANDATAYPPSSTTAPAALAPVPTRQAEVRPHPGSPSDSLSGATTAICIAMAVAAAALGIAIYLRRRRPSI